MAFNTSENQALVQTGIAASSRVPQSNDSLGTLFQGVGNALQNGLNAYDESTKVKIQMAADEAVNGPNGAVAAATPDAQGNFPAAGQAAISNIGTLKTALSQGTISQLTYDREVARSAKALRGSVPRGYGMFVDQALSSATGSSTANQQRQDEMAAADQAARAGNAEFDKMRTWISSNENNQYFYTDNVRAFVEGATGMKMEDVVNNPTPQTFSVLQQGVFMQKGSVNQMELINKTIENTKKVNSFQGSIHVDQVLQNGFNRDVNIPYGKFLDAKAAAVADGKVTGEEPQQITNAWMVAKQGMISDLASSMIKNKIPEEERAAIMKQLTDQLDPIEKSLTDPDMGILNAVANDFKRGKTELAAHLWTISTASKKVQALAYNGYTPDMIKTIMGNDSDYTSLEKNGQDLKTIVAGMYSGKLTAPEAFDKIDQFIPKDQQGQFNKDWLDKLTNVLNQDSKNPKDIATAAKNLFAAENDKLIASLPWERRLGIFQKLMSPKVVSQLVASGDVDALNTASRWGENQLKVISNKAQSNMIDGQKFRYRVNITFDGQKFVASPRTPTTKEFAYNGTPSIPLPWGGSLGDSKYTEDAKQAVNDMNSFIGTMKPIWDAQHKDVATAMGFVMQENIKDIKHEAPILQSLVEGVYNYLQGGDKVAPGGLGSLITSPAGASTPEAGGKPATNQELTSQAQARGGDGYAKVVAAGKGWTTVENSDGSQVVRHGSRNWRNNNPGNIEYGSFAKSQGAVGTDGRFAVFPTLEAGRKAKEELLFNGKNYRGKTILQAIHKWAPPNENDTASYAQSLADAAGVDVNTAMSDLTPDQRRKLMAQMEKVEGFKQGKEYAVAANED